MNTALLTTEIQDYILTHLHLDTYTLLLKKELFENASNKEVIEQLKAKQKCKKKLPTWFLSKNIYYPNKLHIEQTSSEITANYKSKLVSGQTLVDITGGFGVDSYYFSKTFKNVIHCELNTALSRIACHNFKQLQANTITCIAEHGIDYLKRVDTPVDCIYIDPSRRNTQQSRVFLLKDCIPNVPKFLGLFFKYATTIIIKTSPLLDISSGLNDLQNVKTIHCIAVNNDVKEVLWVLEQHYKGDIYINSINFKSNRTEKFSFILNTVTQYTTTFSAPLSYLYEPNAAIMKSGGFLAIASQLHVNKLHPNSHLYTHTAIVDFPGRTFKIKTVLPFNKKQLKKILPKKANITTRNFPYTVSQLRTLFNIKDGGNVYIFFTTSYPNNKVVIVCQKYI